MAAPIISRDLTLPSTPAQEWANKTTSSLSAENLESASNSPETNQGGQGVLKSTASTPGYDFPGAYPRGADVHEPFVVGNAKAAALDAYNIAKSYIPAPADVEKAVLSASETAKQYLPEAIGSYFPSQGPNQNTARDNTFVEKNDLARESHTLPSQEAPSETLGATDGVGALPGSKFESGVAKLPEERWGPGANTFIAPASAVPKHLDTSFLTPHTNANADNNSGSDSMSNISTRAVDGSDVGSEISAASPPHTPTGKTSSYPEPIALGNANNHAVSAPSASGDTLNANARYAETREQSSDDTISNDGFEPVQEPVLNTTARTHPLGKDGTKWKGVPLSEGYQTKLDANSERQLNLHTQDDYTSPLAPETYTTSKTEKAKDGAYAMKDKVLVATTDKPSASTRPANLNTNTDSTRADVGHSPAEKHSSDGSTATNASFPINATDESKVESAASNTSGSSKGSGSGSGSGNGGSPHKSKFMDRIKGEVKVISGKLAHNEEKVEEGRRLMGKSL